MVKSERLQAGQAEPAPGSAWLTALAAWFLPGSGHLLLKKWGRAALMGGAVWVCFFVGLAMGGHMFDVTPDPGGLFQWATMIQVPPMIANLGTRRALYRFVADGHRLRRRSSHKQRARLTSMAIPSC